jgi:hypothetical protein
MTQWLWGWGKAATQELIVTDKYQTYWISRRIFWVQGIYFAVTGIWPLIDLNSFQAVTGPKRDLWLVQMVGAILTVTGLSLCVAGKQRTIGPSNFVLAAGSALVLLLVDVIFTSQGAISPIYLLDGAAEFLLLIAWGTLGVLALRARHGGERRLTQHLAMAFK